MNVISEPAFVEMGFLLPKRIVAAAPSEMREQGVVLAGFASVQRE